MEPRSALVVRSSACPRAAPGRGSLPKPRSATGRRASPRTSRTCGSAHSGKPRSCAHPTLPRFVEAGRSAPWDGTVMWIGAVPERCTAAPAAGVGYPAREGLPGEGYPGKFACLEHRPVVGGSARSPSPNDAMPNALDAPCWATRGTDTSGSRASGPHVPRSYCKAGGLETPGGARMLSTMPARVCGNGGPSILLGTSRDLSKPPIEARRSFVSIHL